MVCHVMGEFAGGLSPEWPGELGFTNPRLRGRRGVWWLPDGHMQYYLVATDRILAGALLCSYDGRLLSPQQRCALSDEPLRFLWTWKGSSSSMYVDGHHAYQKIWEHNCPGSSSSSSKRVLLDELQLLPTTGAGSFSNSTQGGLCPYHANAEIKVMNFDEYFRGVSMASAGLGEHAPRYPFDPSAVRLSLKGIFGVPALYATRDIEPGEEVVWSYNVKA
jgi:hypothetical protein